MTRAGKSVFKNALSIFKPGVGNMQSSVQSRAVDETIYKLKYNSSPQADAVGNLWVRDGGIPNAVQGFMGGVSVEGQQAQDVFAGAQLWTTATNTDRVAIGTSLNTSSGIIFGKSLSMYCLQVIAGDPTVQWSTAPLWCQLYTPYASGAPVGAPVMVWPIPRPPECLLFQPGVRHPYNMPAVFQQNGLNNQQTGGGLLIVSSTQYTYTAQVAVGATLNVSWAYVFGVTVQGLPTIVP